MHKVGEHNLWEKMTNLYGSMPPVTFIMHAALLTYANCTFCSLQ